MPNLIAANKSWPITAHAKTRLWERFGIYVGGDDLDWSKYVFLSLCTNVTMPGKDRKACNHYLTKVLGKEMVIIVGRMLSRKSDPLRVITVMPPEYYATQSWAVALTDPLEKLKEMTTAVSKVVWKE